MLAVSEPSSLPGTSREIKNITRRFEDAGMEISWLDKDKGTVNSVLQGMESYSWVHLACHAHQDAEDPTKSAFILHGDEKLTLDQIMKRPFKNAEFAFLSACQTATGDERLPDEAVHLAAGMLFAGYRTVIGTMWSIKDSEAPLVADAFYSHVLDSGPENMSHGAAAYALHDATGRLREKVGVESFDAWVPFIHLGV